MRRGLVVLLLLPPALGAAQDGLFGLPGEALPAGRPFPWAEIVATVLTLALLLWAVVLRREE